MTASVGVLALQGAFAPHRAAFARLGIEAPEVRSRADLDELSHLVLPGGESTTLHHLLCLFDLWDEILRRRRAGTLALFGTCAGAILLSRGAGARPPTLGLLDAVTERNAYGRQADSFQRGVVLEERDEVRDAELAASRAFPAVFIRAPKFVEHGPNVRVLARDGALAVALEAPGLLATTFHPELTEDPWFHARFVGHRSPV